MFFRSWMGATCFFGPWRGGDWGLDPALLAHGYSSMTPLKKILRQATNQPTNQPTNQTNKQTNKPTNQPTNQPTIFLAQEKKKNWRNINDIKCRKRCGPHLPGPEFPHIQTFQGGELVAGHHQRPETLGIATSLSQAPLNEWATAEAMDSSGIPSPSTTWVGSPAGLGRNRPDLPETFHVNAANQTWQGEELSERNLCSPSTDPMHPQCCWWPFLVVIPPNPIPHWLKT